VSRERTPGWAEKSINLATNTSLNANKSFSPKSQINQISANSKQHIVSNATPIQNISYVEQPPQFITTLAEPPVLNENSGLPLLDPKTLLKPIS
jgi:hypothetical protein